MLAQDEKITTLDAVNLWPIQSSIEFFELLNSWYPGALILLGRYCMMPDRVEARSGILEV
jgi:hypothetical protein